MNETTPKASRSAPLLTAILILGWTLGFGGGAAWIVYAQVSGEPTTALIESCEHRAKPASYVCRGTWTLARATTTGGIVEGVNNDDVGDEVEVRVKGERAYSLSLRLPIVLGVLALSFPVLYVGALLRSRRAPSTHHPREEENGMKRLLVAATVAVVPVVGLLATTTLGATAAMARADVGVTIAGDDPSGVVTSSLRVCKANVTVRLLEQVGARGGGDDLQTGISDTTGLQGGRWTYSFGNPGLDDGRYYAKAKGTDRCKPGFSPTLTIDRN